MPNLKEEIAIFQKTFLQKLQAAENEQELEKVRINFLGRQGSLSQLMNVLKELSPNEKRRYGPMLNELKKDSLEALERKKTEFFDQQLKQKREKQKHFDVTAYKPYQVFGSLHPYTLVIRKIEDIFISMGYQVVDGPEVEHERYNFDALNIAEDHPARDLADTFWLPQPHLLLRTHTSPVQVRVMEKEKPPIAIVSPGKTFRHEATDSTHDFMFLQFEGLFIDKEVSINNLLATMQAFLQELFEVKNLKIRTRPNYFPFVEPGIEIDMSCVFCTSGCTICKQTGWVEICGAGLVHPNVLSFSGINSQEYSGFAFGFGLSRITMLKFGINDIRLLHSGNLDFLRQF